MSDRLSGLSERLSGDFRQSQTETVGTVGTVLEDNRPTDNRTYPTDETVGEIVGTRETGGGRNRSAPSACQSPSQARLREVGGSHRLTRKSDLTGCRPSRVQNQRLPLDWQSGEKGEKDYE